LQGRAVHGPKLFLGHGWLLLGVVGKPPGGAENRRKTTR
jgi:hypothetical protein